MNRVGIEQKPRDWCMKRKRRTQADGCSTTPISVALASIGIFDTQRGLGTIAGDSVRVHFSGGG